MSTRRAREQITTCETKKRRIYRSVLIITKCCTVELGEHSITITTFENFQNLTTYVVSTYVSEILIICLRYKFTLYEPFCDEHTLV